MITSPSAATRACIAATAREYLAGYAAHDAWCAVIQDELLRLTAENAALRRAASQGNIENLVDAVDGVDVCLAL